MNRILVLQLLQPVSMHHVGFQVSAAETWMLIW